MTRESLRHVIATIAYRGGKAVRDAPAGFSEFRIGPASRTPGQILAHVGDLFDWALSLLKGEQRWRESPTQSWDVDVPRFHEGLAALDVFLASTAPLGCSPEHLFQGPLADALTHIGQLAMLRRLAGAPITGENYFRAEIVAGRVGAGQAKPDREF